MTIIAASVEAPTTIVSCKLRFYPNAGQKRIFHSNSGAARWLYNEALAYVNEIANENDRLWREDSSYKGKIPSAPQLFKRITALKQTEAHKWLNEIPSTTLVNAVWNLDSAIKGFFHRIQSSKSVDALTLKPKGKPRKDGRPHHWPRFKAKKRTLPTAQYQLDRRRPTQFQWGSHIQLPSSRNGEKFPTIRGSQIRWTSKHDIASALQIPSEITVSQDASQHYWISFAAPLPQLKPLPPTGTAVGIDLGLKDLFTTSDNVVHPSLKPFRHTRTKLAKLQREMSRRYRKGEKSQSKRYLKAKAAVAKLHAKIAATRKTTIHAATMQLLRRYDIVILEKLNVAGMLKNSNLALSLSDASFYEFRRQLEYKVQLYGGELRRISTWEPTSQACSSCGQLHPEMKNLKQRQLICDCGLSIDRDYNAAINILLAGLARPVVKMGRSRV